MMDWYGNGMGTGRWVFMIAAMTIFWGLVILAGVMIFRGDRGASHWAGTPDRGPVEILDERFARGEIDREDDEARKIALKASARCADSQAAAHQPQRFGGGPQADRRSGPAHQPSWLDHAGPPRPSASPALAARRCTSSVLP